MRHEQVFKKTFCEAFIVAEPLILNLSGSLKKWSLSIFLKLLREVTTIEFIFLKVVLLFLRYEPPLTRQFVIEKRKTNSISAQLYKFN